MPPGTLSIGFYRLYPSILQEHSLVQISHIPDSRNEPVRVFDVDFPRSSESGDIFLKNESRLPVLSTFCGGGSVGLNDATGDSWSWFRSNRRIIARRQALPAQIVAACCLVRLTSY